MLIPQLNSDNTSMSACLQVQDVERKKANKTFDNEEDPYTTFSSLRDVRLTLRALRIPK